MTIKRFAASLVVGTVVSGAVFASAAGLPVSSNKLQAGNIAVGACDADGVAVDYTTTYDSTDQRYEVSHVVVKDLAVACDAGDLKIQLTKTTGSVESSLVDLSTAALAADPTNGEGTQTVSIAAPPAAAEVTGVHVLVEK